MILYVLKKETETELVLSVIIKETTLSALLAVFILYIHTRFSVWLAKNISSRKTRMLKCIVMIYCNDAC